MATFDDDDFASVCDAIRRKDSTCAKFVVSHPPPDYGIELGEALMTSQNDSISDLNLRVDLLVDGTATTDNVDRLSRLFDYISTSKSLRRVSLWEAANTRDHYMVARQTGRRIMRAMQDNPNVVEFELESKVPPADFAHYLRTTQNLLSLSFRTNACDFRDSPLIAQAFGVNRTLRVLKMELATEDHTEKAASILEALYAHPMLRELEVEVDSSYPIFCIDALVGFIRSTSCLEKLSLICFIFSSEETVDMIDALQRNQSISKLTLAMCDVDAEKAEEFGTLMRSDRVSKGIAELTVSGSPRPALLETEESFVDVSRMLCANSFDVESLSLAYVDYDIYETLLDSIPTCLRLRSLTLSIQHAETIETGKSLVCALKKNRSIRHVSYYFFSLHCFELLLSDDKKRLIQAYCERNKGLPGMLVENRESEGCTASDYKKFPTLFTAALPPERTAPTEFLNGLLTTRVAVGYGATDDKKRARQQSDR